ncbi:type II toxin-antitoxin system VapC family toxin [Candidatus Electronema sp. PJ]|uniref:type II toxin-antitoxin system VapC family toxin n=1 Tax=Candidatus Electronema sp. PJ TaxID=3401572 RepID=UPI003AA916AE
MPETVFWDTAAFVALSNAQDALHQQAVQVSMTLARAKALVLTTDAVLTEVANTFSKRAWRPTAWHILESVQASVVLGVAKVVHIDAALWQLGLHLHRSRADKEWGLTDCLSFEVMQAHSVTQAFTSDCHFE